ncbi:winged helix DNA-binding protein [uncultured Bacteroides sp.]|uniref:winged helix DNA-binding protein n=1 Tax=uncultured Bacteroides sp. TaxID=162156 RepID=UPI002AABB96D|nr:winged helix DNA-binding protein [uncultured Bacteroides sp.]
MKSICTMRDIYKAISSFEAEFEKAYQVSLNEAMVLCTLNEAKKPLTSSSIAERTEMKTSHASKVIRSVEEKGLIERELGSTDKRQMFFSLTPIGKKRLEDLGCEKVVIPELLQPLFAKK